MKKYALLFIFSSLVMAEDLEVNKSVQGQNQKTYVENMSIKEESKPISTGNIKLIDTGLNPANLENKDKITLGINTKENINNLDTMKDNIFTQKERESKVFFSLGGHDSISNYKYGLIDNSRIEKFGIDYNLFIKRENFEEDRSNSKLSTDYISTKLSKDKLTLDLELQQGQQEFPGMDNSIVAVKSDKEFTTFGTKASYQITDDLKIGANYYYLNNNSSSLAGSGYTRDYSNSYLEVNGTKDFLYKDTYGTHSIDAKIGIGIDKMESEKNNILFVEGKDRFSLEAIKGIDFNAMAKLEGGNGTNLSFNVLGTKSLDENRKVSAGIYLDSDYTSFNDVIKGSYVNDVVAFKDLENEKTYGIKGGYTYIKDKLYSSIEVSLNSSKDLISYETVEAIAGQEKVIVPVNYDKRVTYMDAKGKVSYTKDENLRGEASLYLSTLNELAYRPNAKAEVEAIYTKDKYEGRLKYGFSGSMYTQNESAVNRESVSANGTVDFLNTYTLSKDYVFSLNITNILDMKSEKMKNYPTNGRLISLGVEIKY